MKRAGIRILTFLVLLQALSPLVVWTLYTLEKHDIVMYYATVCDTSEGSVFVETIEDGTRGFHGACSVVKVLESVHGLTAKPVLVLPLLSFLPIAHGRYRPDPPSAAPNASVFRPPRPAC
ncbi:MAG: hypothetical protein ACKO9V_06695 [Candidatus Kapaibacterium sp.]